MALKKIIIGVDVSYNLGSPDNLIAASHKQLIDLMPKINIAAFETPSGGVNTSGMETSPESPPLPRRGKKKSVKAKRKKPKNTDKAYRGTT